MSSLSPITGLLEASQNVILQPGCLVELLCNPVDAVDTKLAEIQVDGCGPLAPFVGSSLQSLDDNKAIAVVSNFSNNEIVIKKGMVVASFKESNLENDLITVDCQIERYQKLQRQKILKRSRKRDKFRKNLEQHCPLPEKTCVDLTQSNSYIISDLSSCAVCGVEGWLAVACSPEGFC